MQYEERICPEQGNYLVADTMEFENILQKRPLIVDGLTVHPGESTTLYDWFFKPARFVGWLDSNKAIFFLGGGRADLFSTEGYYYDVTVVVTQKRLFKSYRPGSGRDQHLKLIKGKYTWFK